MAERTTNPPKFKDLIAARTIDLTETGPLTYRELQALNSYLPEESEANQQIFDSPGSLTFSNEAAGINYTNNPNDKFGESTYDSPLASMWEYQNYQDLRGEQQPWAMQLLNGTTKGVITAGTTFVNGTLGLVAGLGTAINEGRWSGIWDNPVSRAMQEVTDWSEENIPNYYTDEERNSPWYTNIFTANFIGDKFIKNLGFTIGAFYSGGIYSKALSAVKWMPGMMRAGISSSLSAVGEGSIEALNNSREWYNLHKGELDEFHQNSLNKYQNSFRDRVQQAYDEYENEKGKSLIIDRETGESYDPARRNLNKKLESLKREYEQGKKDLDNSYESALAKLNEDRAKMGNMDLLLNIGILTLTNSAEFGKLYSNGFKTANRTSKIVKRNGVYEAIKDKAVAVTKGVGKGFIEGTEEISQKAGAEIPGNYYWTDTMNYYKSKTDPDAERETVSWMKSFGEGVMKTLGEEESWEEFFIGSLTGLMGVPVFGKANTQQAYLGKDKSFGLVGGLFGELAEYNERVKRDEEIAKALNERMQDPKFKAYWEHAIRRKKFQSDMDMATDSGDEFEFKNAEHSQMVNDVALWDNVGRFDDLIQMITDASEVSDENIREIIKSTTDQLLKHPKYQEAVDEIRGRIAAHKENISKLRAMADEAMDSDEAKSGDPALEKKAMDTYDDLMSQVKKLEGEIIQEEANLNQAIKDRDLYIGPYVDENGNPFSKEDIKGKIEQNRKDILDTIELYRKTKKDIDEKTSYRLNSEQLATLTWLSTHMDNWKSRLGDMSKELKNRALPAILEEIDEELQMLNRQLNNIPTSINSANKEKADVINKKVSNLLGIKEDLNKMRQLDDLGFARIMKLFPDMAELIKISLFKPAVASKLDASTTVWDLGKKIDDMSKIIDAIDEFGNKLNEYLFKPESLEEDMQMADEETRKAYIKNKVDEIKKNIIDNVKDVPGMMKALEGIGEYHDEIVDSLIDDEDRRISDLAKAYKDLLTLKRIGEGILDDSEPTDTEALVGLEAAKDSFSKIISSSKTVDEALGKLREEMDTAFANAENKEFVGAASEVIVGNKFKEILDAYNEALNAKKSEGKDKKSTKKKKGDESSKKGKKGKKSSEGGEESPQGDEEQINGDVPKRNDKGKWTLNNDKDGEGEEDGEIDFSALGNMTTEEAIDYLKSIDLKKVGKEDAAKVRKLLKKFKEDSQYVKAHESSDDENSNADNNNEEVDTVLANDSRFRSWGNWGKYMFNELANPTERKAVYNDHASAQPVLTLLESLGAFEFVDNGSLGILLKDNPNLKIHYIRKKGLDAILLAVEVTDRVKSKVKVVHSQKIGDSEYQFVGVLGYSKKDKTADTNYHIIDKDIDGEIAKAKSNDEYFVSKKYYNHIKHIYSGRMVKSGEVRRGNETISGDVEDRPLKQILHGVKLVLGVYYDSDIPRIPALPNGGEVVPLNTKNSNPRAGSVWLMVQEADGRWYAKAVKVKRFNVEEYNIEEHKDSPILNRIRKALRTICDPNADNIDRYEAKYELQEHLLYFPEGINILYDEDVISIAGVEWGNNIGKNLSVEDKAEEILRLLQSEELDLRFQVETSELTKENYLRELLDSDILTSDLLQARNINASFDLYINDTETGEPLDESKDDDSQKTGHKGSRGVNINLSGTTVNLGRKEYRINTNGTVTHKNQEVADPKIVSQVKLINQINEGNINPLEGTNVYLGTYDDGEVFGIKKNKVNYSVVEGAKLEEVRRKAEEKDKKKRTKRTLASLNSNDDLSDDTDEIDNKDATKGMFEQGSDDEIKEEEDEDKDDDIDNAEAKNFGALIGEGDEANDKSTQPKSKSRNSTRTPVTSNPTKRQRHAGDNSAPTRNVTLEGLLRQSANRRKVVNLIGDKTGRTIFISSSEFLEFVKDPKNGLSKRTINSQEEFDDLLNHIRTCMSF